MRLKLFMRQFFVGIVLMFVCAVNIGLTFSAAQVYSKAVQFARAGQSHFAFMHYNDLLRNYPKSKYRQQALFAVGEYYFQVLGLQEARASFESFCEEYPDSSQKIYALVYLLNIAQKGTDEVLIEGLKRKIIDVYKVSFVFRESKEILYRSPLNQKHKTVISIDKVEFYLEGKLFAQVSY